MCVRKKAETTPPRSRPIRAATNSGREPLPIVAISWGGLRWGGVGWGSTGEGLALPLASLGRIERGRSAGVWSLGDIPPSGVAHRDTAHGLHPRQRRLPTRPNRSRFPLLPTAYRNVSKALADGSARRTRAPSELSYQPPKPHLLGLLGAIAAIEFGRAAGPLEMPT
jgi:hypothetical protein